MPRARGLDRLDRLVTFVDAVVAIAIMLLVLPLVELASDAELPETAGGLLSEHRTQLAVFALSFVVIARIWLAHRAVHDHALRHDRALALLNLGWAATIVVLPFATQLVAALALGVLVPGLGYWGLLLLAFEGRATNALRRLRR